MNEFTFAFQARGEADTERLGRALACVLPPGTVVTLDGPLGAGKTRLVQAMAVALGVDRIDVVSPTFVLVHEYRSGRQPIIHIDAYRMRDEDEFAQLGGEEYFSAPNLVLIEWASRIAPALPVERVEIAIEVRDGDEREFAVTAYGKLAAACRALPTQLADGSTSRAGDRPH